MYQSYNPLQLTILSHLEELYRLSLLDTTLYITPPFFQYLPIDDYSLRLFTHPLAHSILFLPDYKYIQLLLPILKKVSLSPSLLPVLLDQIQTIEEKLNEYQIEEVTETHIRSLISSTREEHLETFLIDNIGVFYDACFTKVEFDFEVSPCSLHSSLTSVYTLSLKGTRVNSFLSPLKDIRDNPLISNPLILFLNSELSKAYYLIPFLERILKTNYQFPLVIICTEVSSDVLSILEENNNKGIIPLSLFLLKGNSFESIYDLSKICGSRIIHSQEELSRIKPPDLGTCGSICIHPNKINFSLNEQNNVPLFVYKRRLEAKGVWESRFPSLASPSILISIGGHTSTDKIYRQHLLSKFLGELEHFRNQDLVFLPNGLIPLFTHPLFNLLLQPLSYSPSFLNQPIYISKKYLLDILKSMHKSISYFLRLSHKVSVK